MLPTRRAVAAGLALAAGGSDPYATLLNSEGATSAAVTGLVAGAFGRDGALTSSRALGLAHVDPVRAMTTGAVMRVASVSKVATAIGFMRLVEEGRVGLDDDASIALGFMLRHPARPHAPITPRMLLSHTSGLRNGPSYPVGFGRPLACAFTPEGAQWDGGGWFAPADRPPGWWAYADVNFALVAQMIERLSGERFDRYMTRHVFAALGLDGGFGWSGVPQVRRDLAATLYRRGRDDAHWDLAAPWTAQIDDVVPPGPEIVVPRAPEAAGLSIDRYVPGDNGFVFGPQGGWRAGLVDLARMGALMAGGGAVGGVRVLRRETVARMCAPAWTWDPTRPNGEPYGGGSILCYGLGVVILTGARGPLGDDLFAGSRGWLGHLGEAYGLYSGLWWRPGGGGIAYAVNGTPVPGDQARGRRSSYTRWEEGLAGALTTGR